MSEVIRKVVTVRVPPIDEVLHGDPEATPLRRALPEWLVTNGLGGYASGTVPGMITRRFHGQLIAALPAPHGRTMMLNHLSDLLRLASGAVHQLAAQPRPDQERLLPIAAQLVDFTIAHGLPVWRYDCAGHVLEKRVMMPYGQNTVQVTYRVLLATEPVVLELEPWINFRGHEGRLDTALTGPYSLTATNDRYEVASEADLPPLRMQLREHEGSFTIEGKRIQNVRYHLESSRGYEATGDQYSPGFFRVSLKAGDQVTFVASVEDWRVINALGASEARQCEERRRARVLGSAHANAQKALAAELVMAADQFIVIPAGRIRDATIARANGDEIRTLIAGYHWFTDWGRDTMISLEGLTLVTGRWADAGNILRTFARSVRDGLMPNMFPEGNNAGLYNTADATLWSFHALDRYLEYTRDRTTLRLLLPTLLDIMQHHLQGTRFGIHVDPADGLLTQGEEGYALTWMDAKVGDLVVTPRRGKAVEINALYYNALCLLDGWLTDERDPKAQLFRAQAERVRASFNARFWDASGGYLYDVIDGPSGADNAFRPNQVFAISLAHAVLDRARWQPVVDRVSERLLTPFGLRTLAPEHPDFRARYFGDLRARDLAYHQGTVWAWLIGPFIDAWLKVYPHRVEVARSFLAGFENHLSDACIGTIGEIFDAQEPYAPRGCVAQAWSVAEVLRSLVTVASVADSVASQPGTPRATPPETPSESR